LLTVIYAVYAADASSGYLTLVPYVVYICCMKGLRESFQRSLLQPPPGASVWILRMGKLLLDDTPVREFVPVHVGPHLVLEGCGLIKTGGGEYPLRAGDMFCLWPGVEAHYRQDPSRPWQLLWCHLIGDGAAAAGRALGLSAEKSAWRPTNGQGVRRTMEELFCRFCRPEKYSPSAVLSSFFAWLSAVNAPTDDSAPANPTRTLVMQAQMLFEGFPEIVMNVSEVARALHVCRTTLFRAFREELKQSPMEYLAGIRLEKAKELLRLTDRKLVAVARDSGYRDEKYFSRVFRQATGTTPGQYRMRQSDFSHTL
jgi:AraC-like DNA-binding protein